MRGGVALAGALVAAAIGGGAVALLGARAAGMGDGTTTVREIAAAAPAASAPATGGGLDAAALFARVRASTVTVDALIAGTTYTGGGFAVGRDEVVTAAHVVTDTATAKGAVAQAEEVRVRLDDGQTLAATIVGYDRFSDVALLRVDAGRRALPALRLADPSRARIGDPVAVVGAPFGDTLAGSLSVGVISGLARRLEVGGTVFQMPSGIQTDAAVNPGDSGGPLLDAAGQVLGVVVQSGRDAFGAQGEGVAFAVPADLLATALAQLRAGKAVTWPWLGAGLRTVEPGMAAALGLAAPRGVLVNSLQTGGPAAAAGLRVGSASTSWGLPSATIHPDGDIVVAADGKPIAALPELDAAILRHRPGDRLPLEVVRPGGARATVVVTLGTRPADPAA